MMQMEKRTDYCGNITSQYLDQDVLLYGWVQRVRNLGQLIFIDLRDREGIVQVVVNHDSGQELMDVASSLGQEYVVEVKGHVNERSSKNPDMKTGDVEVIASEITVLNKAKTPPFEIKDDLVASEQTRLKYRYLDLRRPTLQNALIMRAQIMTATNAYLSGEGFINIETPDLGKSTPEGARDYLVPSRVYPGSFYALPQSPQIFKQLLMGAGFDKYYQIARCFRDEDLRGDRQPEFTQIDLETSFMDEEGVQEVTEGLLAKVMKDVKGIDLQLPLPRITWQESMDKYGCDKPDLRFGLTIRDVTDIAASCSFSVFRKVADQGGVVRAINCKGCAEKFTRSTVETLTDHALGYGAKGMAWILIHEDGEDLLSTLDSDEELEAVYEQFMELLFDDEEE